MSKVVDFGSPSVVATSVTPHSGVSAVKRLSTLPVRSIVFSKSPAFRDGQASLFPAIQVRFRVRRRRFHRGRTNDVVGGIPEVRRPPTYAPRCEVDQPLS
jgi:hypothetical protein